MINPPHYKKRLLGSTRERNSVVLKRNNSRIDGPIRILEIIMHEQLRGEMGVESYINNETDPTNLTVITELQRTAKR